MALFDEAGATPAKPFEDPSQIKIEDLVGEGKKFATPELLAASYAHSQNHISDMTLTQERIAKEADQTKAVSELLEELRKKPTESVATPTPTPEPTEVTPTPKPETQSKSIEDLIAEKFSNQQAQATATQNAGKVKEALMLAYGTEQAAKAAFSERVTALGMTEDQVNQLASSSPAAAIKLLEIPSASPRTGEVTKYTPASTSPDADADTLQELNELRRKNFREWLKPANQRKLNALVRQG